MKRRTVCPLVTILIIGVSACIPSPSISTTTPNSSAKQTPTSTVTPFASLTPPTPTATIHPLPIPTTLLKDLYLIPVKFIHPIVLSNDQFKVTVIDIINAGDSTVGTTREPYRIVVPEEFQDTHYLLQLALTVQKLTDSPLAFGSSRDAWSLVSKYDDGTINIPMGWCQISLRNCAPVSSITLIDNRRSNLFVLFMVPNDTKQIYLYFLGSVPIPHM